MRSAAKPRKMLAIFGIPIANRLVRRSGKKLCPDFLVISIVNMASTAKPRNILAVHDEKCKEVKFFFSLHGGITLLAIDWYVYIMQLEV